MCGAGLKRKEGGWVVCMTTWYGRGREGGCRWRFAWVSQVDIVTQMTKWTRNINLTLNIGLRVSGLSFGFSGSPCFLVSRRHRGTFPLTAEPWTSQLVELHRARQRWTDGRLRAVRPGGAMWGYGDKGGWWDTGWEHERMMWGWWGWRWNEINWNEMRYDEIGKDEMTRCW